ncbi:MAG: hypothetical protein AVDCRST_MAG40-3446, partial [uncultured Gemmatimonadaceae bacterium]
MESGERERGAGPLDRRGFVRAGP